MVTQSKSIFELKPRCIFVPEKEYKLHSLAALSVRFVAIVTIERTQRRHADAWYNEAS